MSGGVSGFNKYQYYLLYYLQLTLALHLDATLFHRGAVIPPLPHVICGTVAVGRGCPSYEALFFVKVLGADLHLPASPVAQAELTVVAWYRGLSPGARGPPKVYRKGDAYEKIMQNIRTQIIIHEFLKICFRKTFFYHLFSASYFSKSLP